VVLSGGVFTQRRTADDISSSDSCMNAQRDIGVVQLVIVDEFSDKL
jgi:hypothetical protein